MQKYALLFCVVVGFVYAPLWGAVSKVILDEVKLVEYNAKLHAIAIRDIMGQSTDEGRPYGDLVIDVDLLFATLLDGPKKALFKSQMILRGDDVLGFVISDKVVHAPSLHLGVIVLYKKYHHQGILSKVVWPEMLRAAKKDDLQAITFSTIQCNGPVHAFAKKMKAQVMGMRKFPFTVGGAEVEWTDYIVCFPKSLLLPPGSLFRSLPDLEGYLLGKGDDYMRSVGQDPAVVRAMVAARDALGSVPQQSGSVVSSVTASAAPPSTSIDPLGMKPESAHLERFGYKKLLFGGAFGLLSFAAYSQRAWISQKWNGMRSVAQELWAIGASTAGLLGSFAALHQYQQKRAYKARGNVY